TNPFKETLKLFLKQEFQVEINDFEFQATRKDFEGDVTLLVFPLLRFIKMNPEKLASEIGAFLVKKHSEVIGFNVVKGFLNLIFGDAFYLEQFKSIYATPNYGHQTPKDDAPTLMVEFSSPNTNKPLHLGHIRNNVLGYAVSKILPPAP
ncbi:MAG: arginine--tRNA ligase, partial [Proteobacteria bacterium]|nr:arginine--tRNA ligase [Pseudomonadota bacterium]